MTISVLIDPTFCSPKTGPLAVIRPQPPVRPRLTHPLDREILNALASASEPVGTWQLLNSLAKSSSPASRAEARAIRQQALARINPLVGRGLVRRIGRGALALP